MKDKYDALKLENQLCFPLYACSKEIVRRYKPYLDEIDLTYAVYCDDGAVGAWQDQCEGYGGAFVPGFGDADTGVKEAGAEGLPHQRE